MASLLYFKFSDFKFKLYYFKMTTKLHLAIEIYKIARINYKLSVFSQF